MTMPGDLRADRLPERFPVGSIYVVVGRGGESGRLRVSSRYVVLPGGRRIDVPEVISQGRSAPPRNRHLAARNARTPGTQRAKKIASRAGTSRQVSR